MGDAWHRRNTAHAKSMCTMAMSTSALRASQGITRMCMHTSADGSSETHCLLRAVQVNGALRGLPTRCTAFFAYVATLAQLATSGSVHDGSTGQAPADILSSPVWPTMGPRFDASRRRPQMYMLWCAMGKPPLRGNTEGRRACKHNKPENNVRQRGGTVHRHRLSKSQRTSWGGAAAVAKPASCRPRLCAAQNETKLSATIRLEATH